MAHNVYLIDFLKLMDAQLHSPLEGWTTVMRIEATTYLLV